MSHDAFVILNSSVFVSDSVETTSELRLRFLGWFLGVSDDFGKVPQKSSGPGRASKSPNRPLPSLYTSHRELKCVYESEQEVNV